MAASAVIAPAALLCLDSKHVHSRVNAPVAQSPVRDNFHLLQNYSSTTPLPSSNALTPRRS